MLATVRWPAKVERGRDVRSPAWHLKEKRIYSPATVRRQQPGSGWRGMDADSRGGAHHAHRAPGRQTSAVAAWAC